MEFFNKNVLKLKLFLLFLHWIRLLLLYRVPENYKYICNGLYVRKHESSVSGNVVL